MATLRDVRNSVQPMLAEADAVNFNTFVGDVMEDLRELYRAIVATTAKLDADTGTANSDYATDDPDALTIAPVEFRHPVAPRLITSDGAWHTFTSAFVADTTELRTQLIAILANLDTDTGLGDSDYESSLTPAALTASAQTEAELEARNDVAPMVNSDALADIRTFSAAAVADITALRGEVVLLTAKLNADTGTADSDYDSNDPATQYSAALTAS